MKKFWIYQEAKHRELFVKPAFYKLEIETILYVGKMNDIKLCEVYCEKGDEAIRFGFGDPEALELMIMNQDVLTVQLVDSIRMSIMIVDNNCLIYFPTMKYSSSIKRKSTN